MCALSLDSESFDGAKLEEIILAIAAVRVGIHDICELKRQNMRHIRLGVDLQQWTPGSASTSSLCLCGPIFQPLKRAEYFNAMKLTRPATLCWPNGADFAPEALFALKAARSRESSPRNKKSNGRKGLRIGREKPNKRKP